MWNKKKKKKAERVEFASDEEKREAFFRNMNELVDQTYDESDRASVEFSSLASEILTVCQFSQLTVPSMITTIIVLLCECAMEIGAPKDLLIKSINEAYKTGKS